MNKTIAVYICKEIQLIKRKIIYKRQKAYFKPFFKLKKAWASKAITNTTDFAIEVDGLLNSYQKKCLKVISKNKIFHKKIDDPMVKAKKYKTHEYLDEKYNRVVVDDIKDTLTTLTENFQNTLAGSYEKYITKGNVRDSAELVYKNLGMEFNFNKFDRDTSTYLREKTIKWSKEVAQSTENFTKGLLVKGYEEGLSTYDIAENIRQSTGFSYNRAESIARTEIMSSCNYAEYSCMMDDANVIGATWSATADGRTRPTHRSADGQKRKKGMPFNVGGYKLLFPLDSSLGAPAGEIINCRCTLFAIFKGEGLDSDTVYDDKDVNTKEWLSRQSEDFQVEYLGGETKKDLFQSNLLSIGDSRKSLNDILGNLYPVKLTHRDISQMSSLPKTTINEVLLCANTLWLYGKTKEKEMATTLKTETGVKSDKNVYGEHGRITPDSKNYKEWIADLAKGKPMSRVVIHNHNNVSGISIDDLLFFLTYESIKSLFAVDIEGSVYGIEKKAGVVYDVDKTKKAYYELFEKAKIEVQLLPEWRNATLDDKRKIANWHEKQIWFKILNQFEIKRGTWEHGK